MFDPTNPEYEPGYDAADMDAEIISELLASLKELLFRVNRNDRWLKTGNPSEDAMRLGVVTRARAAIAKAEGD